MRVESLCILLSKHRTVRINIPAAIRNCDFYYHNAKTFDSMTCRSTEQMVDARFISRAEQRQIIQYLNF